MPAYLYEKINSEGKLHWKQIREISLGGKNAIFNLWKKAGSPLNKGWRIDRSELVSWATDGIGSPGSNTIVINAAPTVKGRVHLVEVVNIYVYTHRERDDTAGWSNLLLRASDLYWDEDVSPQVKQELTQMCPIPDDPRGEVLSFLYLRDNWNWGRIGQMNGAWLHPEAREYFTPFFKLPR